MNKVVDITQALVHALASNQTLLNIHIPSGKNDVEELCDLSLEEEEQELNDDYASCETALYPASSWYGSNLVSDDFPPLPLVSDQSKVAGCVTRSFSDMKTSKRYAQTLSVLALVYSLCTDETGKVLDAPRHMSLRDVYYSLKNIFPNQASCNSILLDVGK